MARRVNKELEKLKHLEYHIDNETNTDTVNELIHYFAMKHGRKLLMVNHGTERVETNFERLDEALKYLGETGRLHDRFRFYPCMSDKVREHYNGEQEEDINLDKHRKYKFNKDTQQLEIRTLDQMCFLSRLINSNNRAKGVFTEDILEYGFKPNAELYFVEFLKIMYQTYRKNGFDEKLHELYDKHIKDYSFIISNENDIQWLRNFANQQRLYNLLANGGTIYQKGNTVDSFKSFFYTVDKIPLELAELSDKDWMEDFAIKPLPLSMDTIRNLINYGYINKCHLYGKYRTLLDRKFYIPKKKRRKRIYIEDAKYLTISDDKIEFTDKRYTVGSYDEGVMKLTRDKKVRKKRYIPTTKNSKWVKVYQINKLIENGKELYEEMIKNINEVDAVKDPIYFPEHWEA